MSGSLHVDRSKREDGTGAVVVGDEWTVVVGEPMQTLEGHGSVDDYVMALDDADREDVERVLDHAPSADRSPAAGMGAGPMGARQQDTEDPALGVHVDLTPPQLVQAALRHGSAEDLDDETGVAGVVDDLVGPAVSQHEMLGVLEEWSDGDRPAARDLLEAEGPVDPALAAVFDADDAEVYPCVEAGRAVETAGTDLPPVAEAGLETEVGDRRVGTAGVRTDQGVQPSPVFTHEASVRAVAGAGTGPGRSEATTPVVEVTTGEGDPALVQVGEGFDADEQQSTLDVMRERRTEMPSYDTAVVEDGPLAAALDAAEHVDPTDRGLTDDLAARSAEDGERTDADGEETDDPDDRSRAE